METIRTYLDNMFKTLPNTVEVNQLKEDLYSNMEDKYNELKSSGKSENEAIGIVISEFGNIDELLSELGLEKNNIGINSAAKSEGRKLSLKEAKSFIDAKKRYGLLVAIGVWLCMFAVNTLLLGSLFPFGGTASIILFFLFVACAVGVFINCGFNLKKYDSLKEEIFDLNLEAGEFVNVQSKEFEKKFIVAICVGVILCILSITPIIAFGDSNETIQTLSVCLFIFIVSIAVFLFVSFGNVSDAYNRLLQVGDYTIKRKQSSQVIGVVASVVFPVAAIVYLLVSLFTDAWGITWIIWPVVGILFGVFSSVYSSLHKKKIS